ncbi:MAG TPA: non-canonical purine NTP pyrophosphatase [Thermoanaerobaculaceae bacterium]|nr:non-canonical purine NTP pyrophosphatase [Thermoanaerobaculaceae bacterium]HRS14636.1 non-canonical purine NTP pyrophosphatase [Thermoanaerobaculaceae bacterium]
MSAPEPLTFVTSSPHKRREAEQILGARLAWESLTLPEIQGLDLEAVARHKAAEAARALGRPVLVEDTGLELYALGGFPGPLVRWLLEAAGAGALPRLLAGFDDKRATARCVAVVRVGEHEWVGSGAVEGVIVEAARGTEGFGWDVVFAPSWGGGRTYAEMPPAEKNARSHRFLALEALRAQLAAARVPWLIRA